MIRVLLVEDDRADARLVLEAFRRAHGAALCVPNHVETLAAALEWLDDASCDVVLLDLSLPDSRGLETLQTVLQAAPHLPVIVLSGFDDPDFATMAVEVGAQDYLVKGSFDGDLLTRTVRYAIVRKHLEEYARLASQRVQSIIELAHDAIVVASPDQTIVMVNPAAERLFGWPAELLVGRNLEVLIPPHERTGHGKRLARMLESGAASRQIAEGREIAALHRDGTEVAVEITVSRTPTPEGVLFTAFIRDVTERRKAAQALRVAKEAAENALMELGRAQARLVQAEKLSALGQLVAGLAHEMNTPIGNALTAASFLQAATGGLRGKLANPAGFRRADLNDYLDSVDEGVRIVMTALDRATGLVQLFKQAASERSDARRCRFSLKLLLADFAAAAAPGLAERGCVLVADCPDDMDMDSHPVALSQVLTHLVSNAAQHGYPAAATDGAAHPVFVRIAFPHPDECRIEVIDHGVGIPENDRLRVFEPFYTTGRNEGHTGLGLHVAFNLTVGPLGGHIVIDAAEPQGTRVTVDLPRLSPG